MRKRELTIEEVRLLTPETVSELLGVSVVTLKAWRHRNKGPVYQRMGKLVRYRLADIMRWQQENLQEVCPSS